MKYALLAYGDESWDGLPAAQKRALHRAHHAHQVPADASARVIAHFRLRPPQRTTTIRLVGDAIAAAVGPAKPADEALRALYLVESADPDAVVDLVSRLPAVRLGATMEIWPLIEPNRREL